MLLMMINDGQSIVSVVLIIRDVVVRNVVEACTSIVDVD